MRQMIPLAAILLVAILAPIGAEAQFNPVYRQSPPGGAATQQQPITVPAGMTIEVQSGASLTCDSGSTCIGGVPTPAATLPPVVNNITPLVCTGGAGDSASLNSIFTTYVYSGIPAAETCNLTATLTLSGSGNFAFSAFTGGGASTLLQPSAAFSGELSIFNIAPTGSSAAAISNLSIANVGTDANNGVHYHPGSGSTGNNFGHLSRLNIVGFPNGILSDATEPGGDGLNVSESFFTNNTTWAVNLANFSINSSVRSNYVLGGPGFNVAKVTKQNEGSRFIDNIVLPKVTGGNSVSISAGLELQFLANIFDQNLAHGVVINAASNPVSAVKFVVDWIGAAPTVAANQDGINFAGTPEYFPIIATTITQWSRYGLNSGTGGLQNLDVIASKFYGNTTGDILLNNVAGAVLIANTFASTASWSEASMGGGVVAIGNRCAAAATGVSSSDLILGVALGACNPQNQIPMDVLLPSGSLYVGSLGTSSFRVTESGGVDFVGPVGNLAMELQANNIQSVHLFTTGGVCVGAACTDPGSTNFNVIGGYFVAGTAGVTCSAGFSATTGRSVLGIVTHC